MPSEQENPNPLFIDGTFRRSGSQLEVTEVLVMAK